MGFNGLVFSQDSLSKKHQHEIGFGLQFTTGFPSRNIDYAGSTEYQIPGYNLFYRLLLSKKPNVSAAFSGGFFYRKGHSSHIARGHGVGQYFNNDFEFVDITLGISGIKRFGKNRDFNFGVGFSTGAPIYSNGIGSLNPLYASLNFELSKAFKLSPKNYLIIGIKQFLETNDFIDSRPNLTSNLFLAYNIR